MRRCIIGLLFASVVLTGCTTPFELGFPGEYPVKRVFIDDIPGIDPIAVYYPDTDPKIEGAPVIVLDTGWNQPRLAYDGYATQFAQWGYVFVTKFVASPGLVGIGDARIDDHVAQNSLLLDWIAEQNEDPNSFLYGRADANNAGVIGHSLGAGIAIDSAIAEPRFKIGVSMDSNYPGFEYDPRETLATTDAAILFFYATEGRWCSGQRFNAPRLFEFTSPPAIEVSVNGAGHLDFMDSLIWLTNIGPFVCPNGSQDAQVVRDIVTRYMIAWANVWLKAEPEFMQYYDGVLAQEDIDAGLVEIRKNL